MCPIRCWTRSARALHLDECRAGASVRPGPGAGAGPQASRRRPQQIRPEVQATLDAFTGGPAFVRNGRLDVLGTNLLGRAVYDEMFQDRLKPPNLARFAFLDDRAHRFYPDWDRPPTTLSRSCGPRPAATRTTTG